MAKERSDKMCFQSKFGGGWINASQFLAEIMCERFAQSQGDHLVPHFWRETYWLKKFKAQMTHAQKLLETYPVEVILKGLAHPDLKKIYSLGALSIIEPVLKRTAWKFSREVNTTGEDRVSEELPDIMEKPRVPFSKGVNPMKKLRDLDG